MQHAVVILVLLATFVMLRPAWSALESSTPRSMLVLNQTCLKLCQLGKLPARGSAAEGAETSSQLDRNTLTAAMPSSVPSKPVDVASSRILTSKESSTPDDIPATGAPHEPQATQPPASGSMDDMNDDDVSSTSSSSRSSAASSDTTPWGTLDNASHRRLQQACPAGCASDGCVLDSTSGGYKCIKCQGATTASSLSTSDSLTAATALLQSRYRGFKVNLGLSDFLELFYSLGNLWYAVDDLLKQGLSIQQSGRLQINAESILLFNQNLAGITAWWGNLVQNVLLLSADVLLPLPTDN